MHNFKKPRVFSQADIAKGVRVIRLNYKPLVFLKGAKHPPAWYFMNYSKIWLFSSGQEAQMSNVTIERG